MYAFELLFVLAVIGLFLLGFAGSAKIIEFFFGTEEHGKESFLRWILTIVFGWYLVKWGLAPLRN